MIRWYIAPKILREGQYVPEITRAMMDDEIIHFGRVKSCSNYLSDDKDWEVCRLEADADVHIEVEALTGVIGFGDKNSLSNAMSVKMKNYLATKGVTFSVGDKVEDVILKTAQIHEKALKVID